MRSWKRSVAVVVACVMVFGMSGAALAQGTSDCTLGAHYAFGFLADPPSRLNGEDWISINVKGSYYVSGTNSTLPQSRWQTWAWVVFYDQNGTTILSQQIRGQETFEASAWGQWVDYSGTYKVVPTSGGYVQYKMVLYTYAREQWYSNGAWSDASGTRSGTSFEIKASGMLMLKQFIMFPPPGHYSYNPASNGFSSIDVAKPTTFTMPPDASWLGLDYDAGGSNPWSGVGPTASYELPLTSSSEYGTFPIVRTASDPSNFKFDTTTPTEHAYVWHATDPLQDNLQVKFNYVLGTNKKGYLLFTALDGDDDDVTVRIPTSGYFTGTGSKTMSWYANSVIDPDEDSANIKYHYKVQLIDYDTSTVKQEMIDAVDRFRIED